MTDVTLECPTCRGSGARKVRIEHREKAATVLTVNCATCVGRGVIPAYTRGSGFDARFDNLNMKPAP